MKKAKTIKRMREDLGLSQQGLSDASGVSRSMVSAIERGDRFPSRATIEAIAAGLDVSVTKVLHALYVGG